MEGAPTAGDIFERVINEDNLGEMGGLERVDEMKDVHEDVRKHAKRVWRPHKTRSKAHRAGIALELEHAAASSGAAPKRLHQSEPRKYSIVEARILLPRAVGCSISCHSEKACEVKYKHKLGAPLRSRAKTCSTSELPCRVALAHVLKWAWVCHEAKIGDACIWEEDALAVRISVRDQIVTRCVNFCRCEWTANRESSGCVSTYCW